MDVIPVHGNKVPRAKRTYPLNASSAEVARMAANALDLLSQPCTNWARLSSAIGATARSTNAKSTIKQRHTLTGRCVVEFHGLSRNTWHSDAVSLDDSSK